MAKSPFELRFDTLELARAHLTEQYNAAVERIRIFENACSGCQLDNLESLQFPTEEDIFILAEKMKRFIDG